MDEKTNASVYILSIVGVVVIGIGIWWLLQQSDATTEPEMTTEMEEINDMESVDADNDIIPDSTESGDTAEVESTSEVGVEPVTDVSGDTSVAVPTPALAPLVINMDSAMFFFEPNVIRAKVGQRVIVNVTAAGVHDFVIDELGVRSATPDGETTRIEFTADQAGSFEFYCSVGSHRQRGQVGTLIVEEA